jgi:large subunit ribosomal protein L6
MSRIGKKPIPIPEEVTVEMKQEELCVSGPKGKECLKIPPALKVERGDGFLILKGKKKISKVEKAQLGLYRSLIYNMVQGVTQGFEKKLEVHGLGYRVSLVQNEQNKQKLVFSLGFSHPVEVEAPEGISFSVTKNVITVSGTNKYLVGQTAAQIRALKEPEPYKGKGIRYQNEVIRRKAGKLVVKSGG